MHSGADDPEGPGFPIQKSQDQCSVTNSPGLIAGSHVFHRLSTPRHPPYALIDLVTPTRTRPNRRTCGLNRPESLKPERRHEHPSPVHAPVRRPACGSRLYWTFSRDSAATCSVRHGDTRWPAINTHDLSKNSERPKRLSSPDSVLWGAQ